MGKSHKYAGAGLRLTTTVEPRKLAEMATTVSNSYRGSLGRGMNKVHSLGAGPGGGAFTVKSLIGMELMHFTMNIRDAGGSRIVTTEIDTYSTSQQKVLMFIPVGPKSMVAYKTYRHWLEMLVDAARSEDSRLSFEVH